MKYSKLRNKKISRTLKAQYKNGRQGYWKGKSYSKKPKEVIGADGKLTCRVCHLKKKLFDFPKCKTGHYGVAKQCKECKNRKDRERHSKNKEKENEKRRKAKSLHREKYRRDYKEYKLKTGNKENERLKKYRKDHRDLCNDRIRRWKQTEKGKISTINSTSKRRFKCKETDITNVWLHKLFVDTVKCEICDLPLEKDGRKSNGKQLDHIIPLNVGGAHTKNNVRYICKKCNTQRPQNGSDLIGTKYEKMYKQHLKMQKNKN